MNNNYFRLFANCIPVRGYSRSTICDLQRGRLQFIPNDLWEILVKHSGKSIREIIEVFGENNQETIVEYFSFLAEHEYIFYCESSELELFPDLDVSWDHPSVITNAIIDIGEESHFEFSHIVSQLEELGCNDLQIRFFRPALFTELAEIMRLFRTSSIKSVDFLIKWSEQLPDTEIASLVEENMRVHSLIVHSAPCTKVLATKTKASIWFTEEVVSDESHCGNVSQAYFTVNLATFTEGLKYNSCLNRKISIDKNGEIRNCPSMRVSYGNIKNRSIGSVLLNNPSFRDVWLLNKDQIDICKDCEFRYVCTDCRAYTIDDGILSKPAKCAYDPYVAEWR